MLGAVLARSPARVRARAVALMAAAGAFIAFAGPGGCGATGASSVKATGRTLTIYSSVPAGQAGDPVVQDVLDAEQLAFTQRAGEVTAYKLSFQRIESTKLSGNARTAIQNKGAIAYIGEVTPGASADTLGITNAQDLLQVSPTDTAAALTRASPAVPNSPNRYYESLKSYGYTFARITPTTVKEAKAQVQEMQSLGVKRLYLLSDGSDYGATLAASVKSDASSAGISVLASQSGADAMLYAGGNGAAAGSAFARALSANPALKLFGPSALASQSLVAALPPGKLSLYVSTPGLLGAELSATGQSFVADFRAAYHRTPAPQAIFGYTAVAAVLDILKQAGSSANDRSRVVKDFFAIKNLDSPAGTFSIDSHGDSSLASFAFERWQAGALHPFKAVQVQG